MSEWRMLTIHQPWASCIAQGRKRWENRSPDKRGRKPVVVSFAEKLEGQWVAIHASGTTPRMAMFPALAPDGKLWERPVPRSAVVCSARIGRVVGLPTDRYEMDPWRIWKTYGIELTEVRRFAVPVPAKGGQGWLKLTGDVLEAVLHQHHAMEGAA